MYILNSIVYENDEKTISPLSQAMMFGYGLFETLKVSNGKILFFDEHFDRFQSGCKILKLNFHKNKSEVKDDCYRLLKLNSIQNGVLKVLYAKNDDEDYLLLTTRINSYKEEDYLRGFKIMISEVKRNQYSVLTFIKSNNYMENILSKQEASESGFDEVIFLNLDDYLAEGSVSNIFWIKGDIVYTPSIECGLLPGIVREKVIRSLDKLDLTVKFGMFTIDDITNADEVFVTNSVMDIMPVCQIEKKLFNIEEASITQRITKEYEKLIREKNE